MMPFRITEAAEESEKEASERDVSGLAEWRLSSSKPGQGLKELRSSDPALFWQSDGPQPHSLSLIFPKRTALSRIDLCLDFTQDESYTPSSLSIRAGNSLGDLEQVTTVELHEPTGWSPISLLMDEGRSPLKTYVLQIVILANHQNGKDTHVRGIKVFGPRAQIGLQEEDMLPFSSLEFQMLSAIR